ncbi:MAG: hypothetical protein C0175_03335 [Caldisericum exile]|uniref:GFO/IDH/MocA-like oxidoreductase domain-containing protein n=1 Tax=Caldisericum exile TaxID=693075 RepID=A0A2J6X6S2_9BACT|nr:MAG: hypothetical protein C0175_03335 [Caldisericum exile]
MIYNIPVEDSGLLIMKLSNGVFMTLDCSWSRPKAHPYWGDVTLRIIGTAGTLYINIFGTRIEVYSNEKGVHWENFGDDLDEYLIEEFVKVVKNGKVPFTGGEDGLATLKVVLKAYKSGKD